MYLQSVRVMPESLNLTTFCYPGPTNLLPWQTSSLSLVCPRLLHYTDLLSGVLPREWCCCTGESRTGVVTSAVNDDGLDEATQNTSHDHYVTVMWPVLTAVSGWLSLSILVFFIMQDDGQKVTQPQHCVLTLYLRLPLLLMSPPHPLSRVVVMMSWSCYPGLMCNYSD